MDGEFNPEYSSNSVWYDTDMEECLTDHIDDMQAEINTLKTGKASINHAHTEYAPVNHSHTGYAAADHTHSYNDLTDKPSMPDMSALTYSANSSFTFTSLNGYTTVNNIYRRGNIVIYKATIVLGSEFQGGTITLTIPSGFAPVLGSNKPIILNAFTWDPMKLEKPMPCPCGYSYNSDNGGTVTADVTYGDYDYSHEQVRLSISGIAFMS